MKNATRRSAMGLTAGYVLGICLILATRTVAAADAPPCLKGDKSLSVDNAQVLDWKSKTKNQFTDRGYVEGTIQELYPNKNGHNHFALQIGSRESDLIEIIYNVEFGALPKLAEGMNVAACGDYITSIAQSGPYPPSPAGALIHWVHKSNSKNHASGFLMIEEKLYGWRGSDRQNDVAFDSLMPELSF